MMTTHTFIKTPKPYTVSNSGCMIGAV
jgi:hypothetical protein